MQTCAAVFLVKDTDPLGIAKYGNIGVVGRKNELSLRLAGAQLANDMVGYEGIVEIVLGLIDDKGIRIVQQEQVKDGGALLAGGEFSHLPIGFAVAGDIEQKFHAFREIDFLKLTPLRGGKGRQRIGNLLLQASCLELV